MCTQDPKAAAFERKNNGELLWINDKTPELILNKLDSLTFDQKRIAESQRPETQKPISDTYESNFLAIARFHISFTKKKISHFIFFVLG